MKGLRSAIQFLTFVQCGKPCMDEASLRQAPLYFPLVGALIGLTVASIDHLFGFAPIALQSALSCAILFLISGGLHMDGVADTADGLLSRKPREEALEIMRDPRSGPMGVAAVVFVILLKVFVFEAFAGEGRFLVLVFIPIAGRTALTFTLSFFPYARTTGRASAMSGLGKRPGIIGAAFFLIIGMVFFGMAGLGAAAATLLFTAGFGLYMKRRLGGYTGDTLGMICELSEITAGLALAVWR